MKQTVKNSGFTLLEVLVSLMILTVALTAIVTIGSTRAETLIELQERNHALIVANNVLEDFYVKSSVKIGDTDGKQDNGNTQWYWKVSVSQTNNKEILRMDVLVSKNSQFDYSYAQLVGFK